VKKSTAKNGEVHQFCKMATTVFALVIDYLYLPLCWIFWTSARDRLKSWAALPVPLEEYLPSLLEISW